MMIFGTPNSTFLDNVMSQLKVNKDPSNPLSPSPSPLSSSSSVAPPPATDSNVVLFDVGWEVAKKVGGIYTVLKSKAPITVDEYKSRYALIGPYNPETAATEFEPLVPGPLTSPVIDNMMKKYGIQVHFGKWLIESYPKVFLIDLRSSFHKLGEWRWDLMAGFEQSNDNEANESIVFGYQTALLLKEFAEVNPNDKYIAHFHEWQAAIGLILLRKWKIPVATIFTTHATLLGRYLSAGGVDLYNQMQYLNMDSEAAKRGIYHKHWIEKKAASEAHVFTTVSEITAYESETILQRKADVILPNGLKLDKFTALHEFQNLHAKYKNVLNEFVRGHFYGHYDFELDNTLYFFTAGRYEYYNKGVDMFLDALAGLNKLLQQSGANLTVVAFIIMPAKTNNFNVESLKGQSYLKDMRRTCNSIVESMGERIFEATSRGKIISNDELLTQEELVMLKRRIYALKQRPSLPPIVTHNMIDDLNDPILNHLRRVKMFNSQEDRVKIIYHPEFLNSTNPLIPLDYTEFVRGCHLGIFASYYEPWGYTPAECTVLGVPSVTSNLTGFANFMRRGLADPDSKGIYIVDRRFKSPQESVEQMTQYLWKFCQLDRRQRIELRNRTEKLSELLDWKSLGKFYTTARSLALERAFPPTSMSSRPSSPLNLSAGMNRMSASPTSPPGNSPMENVANKLSLSGSILKSPTQTPFSINAVPKSPLNAPATIGNFPATTVAAVPLPTTQTSPPPVVEASTVAQPPSIKQAQQQNISLLTANLAAAASASSSTPTSAFQAPGTTTTTSTPTLSKDSVNNTSSNSINNNSTIFISKASIAPKPPVYPGGATMTTPTVTTSSPIMKPIVGSTSPISPIPIPTASVPVNVSKSSPVMSPKTTPAAPIPSPSNPSLARQVPKK
eukprot:gene17023-20280_t